MAVIQQFQGIRQNRRIFATGCCDGNFISRLKEFIFHNGVVNFFLEGGEEAFFAQRIAGFWPLKLYYQCILE